MNILAGLLMRICPLQYSGAKKVYRWMCYNIPELIKLLALMAVGRLTSIFFTKIVCQLHRHYVSVADDYADTVSA